MLLDTQNIHRINIGLHSFTESIPNTYLKFQYFYIKYTFVYHTIPNITVFNIGMY